VSHVCASTTADILVSRFPSEIFRFSSKVFSNVRGMEKLSSVTKRLVAKLMARREELEKAAAATLGGRAAAGGATTGSGGYGGPLSPTSEIETAGKIEPPLALLVRPGVCALERSAGCYQ